MAHYDCIIIGSGAGGGTLSYQLALAGKRVLLLEQGGFLPREKANWDPKAVFLDGKYKTQDLYYDQQGKPFHPSTSHCVGGNTKVYGAALIRLREKDFEELVHCEGISPAWPIKYTDFQPYYLQAEQLYQVHGKRGLDPTDPPEKEPYPYPPISNEPRTQKLFDGFKMQGLNPFYLPLGLRRNQKDIENSPCIRCDTCDGYPCMVDAKSDAEITCINLALKLPNFTLLTHTKAIQFETDRSGKSITSVMAQKDGKIEHYSASIYISSCGAIHSAALLLKSANTHHPQGLANSSGLVGCNYMYHNSTVILGLTRTPNEDHYVKTFGINDYYFNAPDWDYPLGHIQMIGNVKKEMLQHDAPCFTPNNLLEKMARHAICLFACSEDLPSLSNRVRIGEQGRIQIDYTRNNMKTSKRLSDKLLKHLKTIEIGIYLVKGMSLEGVGHQVGTCRFGHDPKTSVLDPNCKAHDLENLYVVDGSFFPSSAAVNPALTIIANALRVGKHLAQLI